MVPLHPLSHLMATVRDQDKLAVSVLSCGEAGNKTTNSLIRLCHLLPKFIVKREFLCLRYGISPENIILYGQSIGTVPTVDLASRFECAAVVLHSPLTSGMRVAFPDTKKTYCFDAFPK